MVKRDAHGRMVSVRTGDVLWVWMGAPQVALVVKNPSANAGEKKTWVRFLGWKDPLEKEMAAHSSTLAWKIPWIEEPGRLKSLWSQRVGHD